MNCEVRAEISASTPHERSRSATDLHAYVRNQALRPSQSVHLCGTLHRKVLTVLALTRVVWARRAVSADWATWDRDCDARVLPELSFAVKLGCAELLDEGRAERCFVDNARDSDGRKQLTEVRGGGGGPRCDEARTDVNNTSRGRQPLGRDTRVE